MEKKIWIGLTVLIILLIGTSFAWWYWNSTANTNVSLTVDGVTVTYYAGEDITGVNLIPVSSKEKGVNDGTVIEKVITASATSTSYLNLYLTLEEFPEELQHESLVWEIYNGATLVGSGNFSHEQQGDVIKLATGQEITSEETSFQLYIWIDGNQDNSTDMMNQTFKFVLSADANDNPNLDTSGANEPNISNGLIPVMYNGSTWVKADSTNTNEEYQWYDYDEKKWANAVLVKEGEFSASLTESSKSVSIENKTTGVYTSSNQGVDDSTSSSTLTFTTGNATGDLSFDYSVSSESGYDEFTISINDTTIVDAISGVQSSSYTQTLDANTEYVITVSYYTDETNHENADEATISNIVLPSGSSALTLAASGDYGWSETYTVPTYTSYTINNSGTYQLEEKNNMASTDAIGKYICSDTISISCKEVYQIKTANGNNITAVDVYGTTKDKDIRGTYQSASVGTEITEDDVLAYYVWIPRYKYKVFNITKTIGVDSYDAQNTGIDIVFENGTETTGTITCNDYSFASPTSTTQNQTCTGSNGEYYTHPAFTFGDKKLEGIWVGKYEISTSSDSTCYESSSNDNCRNTTLAVRTKPNANPWTYNYLSNFSTVIQAMSASGNEYGIATNAESHMLKNMEWGAVAYLTNSDYGRCSDGTCSEIGINSYYGGSSATSSKTGCGPQSTTSKKSGSTCNEYNSELGQLASTTGNVYGIYDMSGGAYEYVMGNSSKSSGSYAYNVSSASSNFSYSTTTAKYVDTYAYGSTYNDQTAYNRSRLGDATGEVVLASGGSSGWYSDYACFAYSARPWFIRGGYCYGGADAGVFLFDYIKGSSSDAYSARAALLAF